ncbi:MAG: BrnA antitoxin family protein [Spirochaetota bacterium]|nr:BrnA antitoxin family protein [Spirochaetota bacterium]
MSGLQMNLNKEKKEILAAIAISPENGDYVWNGKDEDDRPLSKYEMREGIKNKGGRPKLENAKKSTTIRLDVEVLDYFKSQGKGWQTRINDILQKYVNSQHTA